MIKLNNISHHIGKQQILHDITLSLPTAQVIALIGPNGAGKSTLFSVMARLQPLQSGQVSFAVDNEERDIVSCQARTLAKTVAMLGQDNHVQGRLRVHELLMFGRYPYHQGQPTADDQQKVQEILERFELEPLAERFLSTLSGGQRQRVLIAMIVCQDTPYLLLDEPLNNLDMYHAGRLMRELRQLSHNQQKTVVIVLHDINQAAQFADTVVTMKAGEVTAVGCPADVITKETMKDLYNVDVTVLSHQGRPVIVDTV
ncbi:MULTISPECIES: ABC transporter ATP-binding protein [Psychrobacter]|jgi:iron complex transport system ATP-binding protein|uniref:iron ABC transporter ATP-binding protein n=1 Tax=Psychrobacter TaxID=497 RepID=UPI000C346E21|nr:MULTISPECIES: ATP-binding cassette domain-containing protein [Psychrobacter]MBA6245625.1 ATP-binding cassette domain-containing protein [Psychrobacter sp. Urea-trap-18]MBA6286365.1 ATP-binding cassette domain-containing protein [Psychrobacter sp. Urea-trap-16]MBA6317216.1 ATP-binding cassette domain-containing protein [Psychrobacter sp. Urea-trap-20]MBA6333475.1 ATP-binding cassette domain-containing protein [Psychrobacter sp. Urea-trap-19]PKG60709.1 iron ABC transporter ATP-binding protein|tara:strand:- start:42433 stop:43203 length:771 start_codon:yes stop_codon:yes gene_type:complete